MALEKEIEINETGILVKYIKLQSIRLIREDNQDTKLLIECSLFKDKKARDSGKRPISNLNYTLDNPELVNTIVSQLYGELKKTNELSDAIDV